MVVEVHMMGYIKGSSTHSRLLHGAGGLQGTLERGDLLIEDLSKCLCDVFTLL